MERSVSTSSPEMMLLVLGIGLASVVAALYVLAVTVRNEIYLHDLRVEVVSKRNEYIRDLYGLDDGDIVTDIRRAKKIKAAHDSALKASEHLADIAESKAAA